MSELRAQARRDFLLFAGTYSGSSGRGIHAFRFSAASGMLAPAGLAAACVNPSFLALHPSLPFLYAVGEVKLYDGQLTGFLSAYAILADTGRLKLLNTVASMGAGPCHVAIDRSGRAAVVANYSGGTVAAFGILSDGGLGEPLSCVRYTAGRSPVAVPRPHGVFWSPDNRFVLVPDLGLDRVFVYRSTRSAGIGEPAEPSCLDLAPGSGPRHIVFHPSGRYVYVLNETASTITSFQYDLEKGQGRVFHEISTLEVSEETVAAEIAIDAEGRFLYASNRGADNMAVFAIGTDGLPTLIEHVPTHGKCPRHFALDPTGRFVLVTNQHSDSIVSFRRDPSTGRLSYSGHEVELGAPACLVFVPGR